MRADIVVPAGPTRSGKSVYPPVLPRGPLTVAARLRELGYETRVIDCYSFPNAEFRCDPAIGDGAALVGISVHGSPAVEPAIRLASRIRSAYPDLPIVFGGNLVRVAPESILPYVPSRSAIICGADLTTIGAAVERLRATAGVEIFRELPRAPDEEEWGLGPVDCLIPQISEYLNDPDFEYHLATQEGCPYRCLHCGTGRSGLFGRVWYRLVESVASELGRLAAICYEHGCSAPDIWIADETFISNRAHARRIAELFAESGGRWRWRAQTRLDCADEEIFGELARAGCYKLAFGVEIPTNTGLQLLGKREVMEGAIQVFHAASEVGISPEAIIVIGTPEDVSTVRDTVTTLRELRAASVQSYIYHPVPGSPWWRRFGPAATVVPELEWWSRLDFHTPPVNGDERKAIQAVGDYLALQLWRPADNQSELCVPAAVSCLTCKATLRLTALSDTGTTLSLGVEGRRSTSIVAWNALSKEALALPCCSQGNIHSQICEIYPVETIEQLVTATCPDCAFSKQAEEVA
jgi:anaerobic magnesium-protoporphyrin IX monomethyl ester cyclase